MTRTDTTLVNHGKRGGKSSQKENINENNRKRKSKPGLSKEERLTRNGKGWMEGLREKCMLPLVSEYADARLSGDKAEKVKMREILSKFHFWFPYPLKDHEEPTEVMPYDPHYIAPEGTEEFEAAKGAHLMKYNKRIKAWVMRRLAKDQQDSEDSNKLNLLMAHFSAPKKPTRARSALQQWQKANWRVGAMIETTVLTEWEEQAGLSFAGGPDHVGEAQEGELSYPPIDFITLVATRLFKALPTEEQDHWKLDAKNEARMERDEYQERIGMPLDSADAISRAAAVRRAPKFISTINRGVELSTALRLTTLAAGPMARKKGEVGFFMVSTSANRAPVPMTFQEWYGEERTKNLMDAYKEWVESCVSPGEALLAQGKPGEDFPAGPAYLGSLGKGLTTDDMSPVPRAKRRSRDAASAQRTSGSDGGEKGDGKAVGVSSETTRPRRLRKKAGEALSEESSSSDGEDGLNEWSAQSGSEESDIPNDTSEEEGEQREGGTQPSPFEKLSLKRKEIRQAKRDKRAARDAGVSSRKSSRKRGAASTEQAMEIDSERIGHMDGAMDVDDAPMDIDDLQRDDDERMGTLSSSDAGAAAVAPTTEDPSPLSSSAASVADGSDRLPIPPPPSARPTSPMDASRDDLPMSSSPPVSDRRPIPPIPGDVPEDVPMPPSLVSGNDKHMREIILRVFPDVGLGLEKGLLRIPSGLGDLPGMLKCGARGLDFLLLPFNEFFQADGGDQLRGVMEKLISVELSLSGGGARDTKGRKKAVVPVASRPQAVSAWVGIGRCRVVKTGAPMTRIVIKPEEIEGFVTAWEGWWSTMQPGWRVRDGVRWKRETYGEDWHSLTVPGQNGLLSVVATLSWWGSAVRSMKKGDEVWKEAVTDVEWMLTGLLGSLEEAA